MVFGERCASQLIGWTVSVETQEMIAEFFEKNITKACYWFYKAVSSLQLYNSIFKSGFSWFLVEKLNYFDGYLGHSIFKL